MGGGGGACEVPRRATCGLGVLCNAVLLDGATYVCYAARVHALHPLQPTRETLPARCLRRAVARTLSHNTPSPHVARRGTSGTPTATHPQLPLNLLFPSRVLSL